MLFRRQVPIAMAWSAASCEVELQPGRSGAYFAFLFALVVGGSVAGALYVNHEASRDARRAAQHDALFSARTAAEQLDNHVTALKASAASSRRTRKSQQVFDNPEGCTLSFQGMGGPDKGHIDIIGADGKVACSSRP